MRQLITYQDYLNNGGIIIPEVTSYDKSNNITSIEEKFDKWLVYTQIQLNYVLQDKLEFVQYNLLNIDEPYRRDIINILVIRLNRAFENDRIISRDENTQYSEMGAINWSSIADQNPYFWNLQELNIIETSGLLEVVSLYCDDYVSEKNYPANLTTEMNNRLTSDGTIDIKKQVNISNGITSLKFSVTNQIARKSEIPNVTNFATKQEVSKKQDELSKEQLKNIDDIPNKELRSKHNQDIEDLKQKIFKPENIKKAINAPIDIMINGKDVTLRPWDASFDNNKFLKNYSLFDSNAGYDTSDLIIGTLGFIGKFYATKEEVNKIKPPDISKADFEKAINELKQQINNQTIQKWYIYELNKLQIGKYGNDKIIKYLVSNNIKVSPWWYNDDGNEKALTCQDGTPKKASGFFYESGSSTNAYTVEFQGMDFYDDDAMHYRSTMTCSDGQYGGCRFGHHFRDKRTKIKILLTVFQKQEFDKLIG